MRTAEDTSSCQGAAGECGDAPYSPWVYIALDLFSANYFGYAWLYSVLRQRDRRQGAARARRMLTAALVFLGLLYWIVMCLGMYFPYEDGELGDGEMVIGLAMLACVVGWAVCAIIANFMAAGQFSAPGGAAGVYRYNSFLLLLFGNWYLYYTLRRAWRHGEKTTSVF